MATNPYSSPSISGYNSNPPSDDGSQTSANEITWAKHKTKLGDPIKTYAAAIDSAVTTAFSKTVNTDDAEDNTINGSIGLGYDELTLDSNSNGTITPDRSHHTVDTASDAASGDLDTIATTNLADGALLILSANNASRTIVLKHSADNILLADDNDFSLDDTDKRILLQRFGSNWYELARAPSGLTAATQADMEAASATNVAVTPGRAQHHPSAAKGWVEFDTAGSVAANYNVDSIDDNGTSDFDVNWSTDFSSVNYCVAVTLEYSTDAARFPVFLAKTAADVQNVGAITSAPGRSETSITAYYVAAYGDQ
jgi:hypothetical protein